MTNCRHNPLILTLCLSIVFASGAIAHADEAYLCGPDTVVYVKAEDLEQKKQTDPCIAAYYGLTIEKSSGAVVTDTSPSHARTIVQVKSEGSARNRLKHSLGPDKSDVLEGSARRAQLSPPVAAPGTDYRKIRVINATSPDDMWFLHDN